MPRCAYNTRAGTRCRFKARPGSNGCGHHAPVPLPAPVPCVFQGCTRAVVGGDLCVHHRCAFNLDGHQCTRAVVIGDLCAEHDELDRAAEEEFIPVLVAEWNQFVPQAQGELDRAAAEDPVLVAEWNQFVPQAQGELGQFAHDRQNVHTSVVTEITNRGLEHLLSFTATKSEMYVMRYIESTMLTVELLESNVDEYNWFIDKVLPDMQSWYKKTTCRAPGDNLYKRVVQGVFAKIQTYPKDIQKELWKRFEEEASDSVGMCCDGHITRMVNVFAGIDE